MDTEAVGGDLRPTVRLSMTVSGRVQGVGYRYFIVNCARALGLRGWVRNEDDGAVKVVAEGHKDRLERLKSYAQQGPPSARVAHVDIHYEAATNEFRGFDVTYW